MTNLPPSRASMLTLAAMYFLSAVIRCYFDMNVGDTLGRWRTSQPGTLSYDGLHCSAVDTGEKIKS